MHGSPRYKGPRGALPAVDRVSLMPPYPQTAEEAVSLPWLRTLTPQMLVCHLHAMTPMTLEVLKWAFHTCSERAPLRLPEGETLLAAHVIALHPEMVLVDESEETGMLLKAAADAFVERFDRFLACYGARDRARARERCAAFVEQVGRFEPMYAAWKERCAPGLVAHARAELAQLLLVVQHSPIEGSRELAAEVLAHVEPCLESIRVFLSHLPGGLDVIGEFGPAFTRDLAPHRALCE